MKCRSKTYLIVVTMLCIILPLTLSSCGEDELSENTYLKAINSMSEVTKAVQVTSITDEDVLVSKNILTIKLDSGKVMSELIKRTLSSDIEAENEFDEQTETIYFYNDNKYTFNGNEWVVEDGEFVPINSAVQLQKNDLIDVVYSKKISKSGNRFTAKIKDSQLKKIFGEDFGGKSCKVTIKLNSNKKISQFEISYKTSTGKNVIIKTTYTYNKEEVVLPI